MIPARSGESGDGASELNAREQLHRQHCINPRVSGGGLLLVPCCVCQKTVLHVTVVGEEEEDAIPMCTVCWDVASMAMPLPTQWSGAELVTLEWGRGSSDGSEGERSGDVSDSGAEELADVEGMSGDRVDGGGDDGT